MSQLYHKYRNLFLGHSYHPKLNLNTQQNQLSFKSTKEKSLNFRYERNSIFQKQILPQINQLNHNQQELKRRAKTQENISQSQFNPNPEQNYKINHEIKKQNFFKRSNTLKPSERLAARRSMQPLTRKWNPIQQNTQNLSIISEDNGMLPCSFQKINQYVLVNQRLNDIKRASKYERYGNKNDYRNAIKRRVQAKKQLIQRKYRLKQKYNKEYTQYADGLPQI